MSAFRGLGRSQPRFARGIVLFGILSGVVYAIEDGRSAADWSDWLRGLAFPTLPFVLVMLVQLLGILQGERPLSAWLILGLGEAIRRGRVRCSHWPDVSRLACAPIASDTS